MSYVREAFKNNRLDIGIILDGLQEYDNKLSFPFENSDIPLIISVMQRRLDAYKSMSTEQQLMLADAISKAVQPNGTLIQVPIPGKNRGEQKC